jgi:acetolactate synthase-1/2/3 large subunit
MQMSGAEALVRSLEQAGVEYVFGICGHANVSVLDALESSSIRFVYVRHEQNAAHMADAYYRFSHKPGVVLTTLGPGMANAITGVWEAAMGCSGVIVISGDVQSYMMGRGAFQELSMHSDGAQYEVFRPFTKRAWQVRDPALIPYVAHRAFNLALTGKPGPVLIDVPVDYFAAVRDFEIPDISRRQATSMRVRGDAAEVRRAVELLMAADRPVIHAGNGVTLSEAGAELATLAGHLGIPVTTSIAAHGVFDTEHSLYGGMPGAVGTPTGNALAREADVVLGLGTGFCEMETSSWDPEYSFRFGEGASLIQVDIDPHELGRAYPVEVGIFGDIRTVLREMIDIARSAAPQRIWSERAQVRLLRDRVATWNADKEQAAAATDEPVHMERFASELVPLLDEHAIIVCDVGAFRHAVYQYLPIRRPQSWYFPSGLVTMGAAPAAALGAKLADRSRPVICFVGDGGFSANSQALATAVEADIPVVYVVVSNFANDAIRAYQLNHYDGRINGTIFEGSDERPYNPDFVAMAESYGAKALRIRTVDEITPTMSEALASAGPCVVEVVAAPMKPTAGGNWDVNDVLRAEGNFKRQRDAPSTTTAR